MPTACRPMPPRPSAWWRIGDYDVCPCIGKHVRSTAQIGRFELLGTNWNEEKREFRVRFKIVQ